MQIIIRAQKAPLFPPYHLQFKHGKLNTPKKKKKFQQKLIQINNQTQIKNLPPPKNNEIIKNLLQAMIRLGLHRHQTIKNPCKYDQNPKKHHSSQPITSNSNMAHSPTHTPKKEKKPFLITPHKLKTVPPPKKKKRRDK